LVRIEPASDQNGGSVGVLPDLLHHSAWCRLCTWPGGGDADDV